MAVPRDAVAVDALQLQLDRELGAQPREGFLDQFAEAWLAEHQEGRRVTWLAEQPDGRPVAVVHGAVVQKLPSLRRASGRWVHVSLVFVSIDVRGRGLATILLDRLIDWARDQGIIRIQLNAGPQAGGLYERQGFGPPAEGLKELRLDQVAGPVSD